MCHPFLVCREGEQVSVYLAVLLEWPGADQVIETKCRSIQKVHQPQAAVKENKC